MLFEIDGSSIHYEVDGPEDAPVVLHWNGANCTLRMWDQAIPRISDRFRSVRFDARGVGKSSPASDPESEYTFERYTKDVNAILDSLGAEQVHIWSMAWGSRGAIAYTSLCPERVMSAAYYDANLGPADVTAQREGHKEAVRRQLAAGISEFERGEGITVHDNPAATPLAMAAAGKFDFSHVLDHLTMPVLLATGDCDPNLPFTREIADAVAHARMEVMEHVGHGSVIQRPDLASKIFLEFHRAIGTIG